MFKFANAHNLEDLDGKRCPWKISNEGEINVTEIGFCLEVFIQFVFNEGKYFALEEEWSGKRKTNQQYKNYRSDLKDLLKDSHEILVFLKVRAKVPIFQI